MKKFIFVFISTILLTACGFFDVTGSGNSHYGKSKNGVPLVVPPPLVNSRISHAYDLPQEVKNTDVSIEPPIGVGR